MDKKILELLEKISKHIDEQERCRILREKIEEYISQKVSFCIGRNDNNLDKELLYLLCCNELIFIYLRDNAKLEIINEPEILKSYIDRCFLYLKNENHSSEDYLDLMRKDLLKILSNPTIEDSDEYKLLGPRKKS